MPTTKSRDREQIKAAFADFLPVSPSIEPELQAALHHVLAHPGSLARPEVVLRMSLAYGFAEAQARDLAVALEYFHTASLLFDDLPCMDNAAERRGGACTHVLYGEATTLLTALTFVNRAYALLWKAAAPCERDRQSRGMAYLEARLGPEGVLGGQSLDLHYSHLAHDAKIVERIALGKTVALIRLALVLPAILGSAPEREIHLLERISVFWGLGYQVLDDLKDQLQKPEESGKTGNRDALLDRPNMVALIGVPEAVIRLDRFVLLGDRCLRRLAESKPSMSFLVELRNDLQTQRDRIVSAAATVRA